MNSAEHSITPDEIYALEKYITLLREDSQFYKQERNLPKSKYNPVIVTTIRSLLEFHKKQVGGLDPYVSFEGQHYYLKNFAEILEHPHNVIVTLHDQYGLLLYLTQSYTESLNLTARHQILKKPLSDLTGYDLYKIAMYVLENVPKDQSK